MTRALIVGFGRAGKRHGAMLDKLGIEWAIVDPYTEGLSMVNRESYASIAFPLVSKSFDFTVICTPPDLHLAQIRQCLDAGLSVLCEKPLCGLGQLAEAEELLQHPNADRVMVAYNFRFHPKLTTPNGTPDMLVCRQQRDSLPDWGLLLDHCSHDLDIMRSQVGEFEITSASHNRRGGFEWWAIEGQVQGQPVSIEEWVGPSKARIAKLAYADKVVDIDADPQMYKAMWEAFLSGNYYPGLAEAIETQRLLERCAELAR